MIWFAQILACGGVVLLFFIARTLAARLGNPPWASPVLIAAVAVAAGLWLAKVGFEDFEAATTPLRAALAPAIVALGALVHRGRALIAAQRRAVLVAVTGGTATGVLSAIGLAHVVGLNPLLTQAVATKTLSTPFAVAVATSAGGPVPLAAALAVLTGVIGALLVPPVLRAVGVRGAAASGTAIGVSAHLVGTDWLTRRDPRAAGFSAVAMVVAGVLAALCLPVLWTWLTG